MKMVTVCSKCKTSLCWRGVLMCDDAQIAGIIELPLEEVLALKKEHPSHILPHAYDVD